MKTKNLFIASALVCLTLLFTVISCGKGNGYSSPNTTTGGGGNSGYDIGMAGMSFSPSAKTVAKGTVVTWKNTDGIAHTVTSNDGTSFNSGTLNPGATFTYTANVAGTFEYHCLIHGVAMSGTLIVNQ